MIRWLWSKGWRKSFTGRTHEEARGEMLTARQVRGSGKGEDWLYLRNVLEALQTKPGDDPRL